jgi:hypothetical protein
MQMVIFLLQKKVVYKIIAKGDCQTKKVLLTGSYRLLSQSVD